MNRYHVMLVIFSVVLIWSGIGPKDTFTWWLEVLPALIGVLVMSISVVR